MATLVLTAVGTLIGGPIGGAIGSLVGNQIDRALFTPNGAKGPRLGSLAVQSSSYGSELPRIFGRMRVAGSVIWATDLREESHRSGGKGKPKSTSYSYSASFAVALSAKAIADVGRIWADGSLLRGAGGDWKSGVGAFRLYMGGEGQGIDPLIAAAEGIDTTPAYRGVAYAVFEDLQLADFGNRIPSLSFEVIADMAAVTIAEIAGELSDGDITGSGGPALLGYAAGGDSVRGAIEGLAAALPVAFADGADGVSLVDEDATAISIAAAELGTGKGDTRTASMALDRQAAGTLNEAIAIGYYDPALDYQAGSQSARRVAGARRAGSIELPAAVDAADAKAIAEARLAREWAGRTTATLSLPWRRLDCVTGTILTLPGQEGRWRVTQRDFEAMVVTLSAMRLPTAASGIPAADPGRTVSQPDLAQGPTTIALLDLPSLGDDPATVPTLLIAAAGVSAGWRRATLMGSLDGGASWQTIGTTAAPAVIGQATTVLAPGGTMLVDRVNDLEVTLLNDAMTLGGSDLVGISATTNLALIGDELVQFGVAERIDSRHYRLSHLLRGRRGSEWAATAHAAGERFVLIDAAAMATWTLPASAIGADLRVSAIGIGDAVPLEALIAFQARAMRPPAPVAVMAVTQADGSVACRWTRRSRAGWNWIDGGDAPIGEEAERYRLTLARGVSTATIETAEPATTISSALLAGLGAAGPTTVSLAQIGTIAPSAPPTTFILP
jgi:hypothetical protein